MALSLDDETRTFVADGKSSNIADLSPGDPVNVMTWSTDDERREEVIVVKLSGAKTVAAEVLTADHLTGRVTVRISPTKVLVDEKTLAALKHDPKQQKTLLVSSDNHVKAVLTGPEQNREPRPSPGP